MRVAARRQRGCRSVPRRRCARTIKPLGRAASARRGRGESLYLMPTDSDALICSERRAWLTYCAYFVENCGVRGTPGAAFPSEHLGMVQKIWRSPSRCWRAVTVKDLPGVSCVVEDSGLTEGEAGQLLSYYASKVATKALDGPLACAGFEMGNVGRICFLYGYHGTASPSVTTDQDGRASLRGVRRYLARYNPMALQMLQDLERPEAAAAAAASSASTLRPLSRSDSPILREGRGKRARVDGRSPPGVAPLAGGALEAARIVGSMDAMTLTVFFSFVFAVLSSFFLLPLTYFRTHARTPECQNRETGAFTTARSDTPKIEVSR